MAEKRKLINEDAVYNSYRSTAKPQSTAVPTLDELYRQITTRPAFQYDAGSDPLYQQYRDRYVDQGRMAMQDTMGQAAGLTGGYGSSYGQAVGQQAYDRYMQGLTDKIPELYDAAYNRWQGENNRLLQQYSLAKDREDTAYSRQQDSYQRLYSLIAATGYEPTNAELAAAGMPREVASRLRSLALMNHEELSGITDQGVRVGSLISAGGTGGASSGGTTGGTSGGGGYTGGGGTAGGTTAGGATGGGNGEAGTGSAPTRREVAAQAFKGWTSGELGLTEFTDIMRELGYLPGGGK